MIACMSAILLRFRALFRLPLPKKKIYVDISVDITASIVSDVLTAEEIGENAKELSIRERDLKKREVI